ncbi:MAG: CoA-binding protein, partial [Thermoplasmata archaeon]
YAGEEIFGIKVIDSLLRIKERVDIVDVFRNPLYIEEIIKDAIKIKAGVIWLQPGSENIKVIEKYKEKINIIYDSCLGVVSKMI